jgi:benzoate transport
MAIARTNMINPHTGIPGTVNPTSADIRALISHGPICPLQFVVLAVCVGLNMLDGFDVLVMSFTASGVSAEWKLTGSELGLLLSAGLMGMAAGSLFLAPRADRIGRRAIILLCVIIVSTGMLLSGFCRSVVQLAVLRVITGIGIGGILASATVMVSEFSSMRWRSTASCLYTSGYSIGASAGGAIAALFIAHYGWRSAFLFGALASATMLPLVYWGLPESVDFLVTRRPVNALSRLNLLLSRMRHATLSTLPTATQHDQAPKGAAVIRLLSTPLARPTTLIWIAFFFVMAGYYFVYSWTPRLLTVSGLTAAQGITGGVLLSVGGIVGTIVFAFIAATTEIRRLTCLALMVATVLMALFALTLTNLQLAMILGVLLGGVTTGAMAGFYALTPTLYQPDMRTTGMGSAIGIGRLGAILSPIGTGKLVDLGWHPMQLYFVFASVFLVAMLGLLGLGAPVAAPVLARRVA